jgi:hypothetical protein
MSALLQVPGQAPGKPRVGQAVCIKHGFRGIIGEAVEDRGPIGVRGRRLDMVRLRLDPCKEHATELPEDTLEVVVGGSTSTSQSDDPCPQKCFWYASLALAYARIGCENNSIAFWPSHGWSRSFTDSRLCPSDSDEPAGDQHPRKAHVHNHRCDL